MTATESKTSIELEAAACLDDGEHWLAARHLRRAIEALDRAENLGADPDRCSAGRWTAAMLGGKFEDAWRESDAIRRRGAPDPHRFWQGESIAGKRVIVRCLHGFGDAVQFLRYAPRLRSLASRLVVEVPPRLLGLARCLDGVSEAIAWGDGAPQRQPEWDVQVEVMELPYLLRTELRELPVAAGYLRLPQAEPLPSETMSRRKIGLAWAAGSWNPARNLPPALLQLLLAVPDCEFWSLQGGPDRSNRQARQWQLREHEPCRQSIMGLAATISRLDLVITVDTLAAHLAGALGVPAWVMLQHEADWRWMHDRGDSPWYPSLRLFRQPVPGDWASAIDDVRRALRSLTGDRKAA